MKKDIHPKYGPAKVTCGCGNTWETRSTLKEIKVEVCSKCHPFYTGTQKFIDTAGRVERFQRKYKWTEEGAAKAAEAAGEKEEPRKKAKAPKQRKEAPKIDLRPKVIKRPAKPAEGKPVEGAAPPQEAPAGQPSASQSAPKDGAQAP